MVKKPSHERLSSDPGSHLEMRRRDRELARHLRPGENEAASIYLSGSRDLESDVPEEGLTAILTTERVLFFRGAATEDLYWWVGLDQLAVLDSRMDWQRGFINKGRETTLFFRLRDGQEFVATAIHVVESRRRVDRFAALVKAAIAQWR